MTDIYLQFICAHLPDARSAIAAVVGRLVGGSAAATAAAPRIHVNGDVLAFF